ncbi:hypothetical protein NHX12_009441, partial [Muraenolepis orangiensis]
MDKKVSLESLQKLKLAFEEYEMDGLRSLDERTFCTMHSEEVLGSAQHIFFKQNNFQIQGLFMKIDYMRQGKIAWASANRKPKYTTDVIPMIQYNKLITATGETDHFAPIFYLCISSEDGQIFLVSMDNTVKIWDIQYQCCLFTAQHKVSLIHGDLSACPGHVTVSHGEPVLCCGYSEKLRQVVSCSEGSVIKVDETDHRGKRRLSQDLEQPISQMNHIKPFHSDGECHEICDCAYLKIHRNVYVLSAGWNRKIDIYTDSPEDPRQLQIPQPAWPDDLRNGHKEDILCMAQCTPGLLATGSYDGEILVWNAVSRHIQCRFYSHVPTEHHGHAQGYVNFWSVQNAGKLLLQIVESDRVLLTSSTDCTVRPWSVNGEFIVHYNLATGSSEKDSQ